MTDLTVEEEGGRTMVGGGGGLDRCVATPLPLSVRRVLGEKTKSPLA